jgi:hypothetical protein
VNAIARLHQLSVTVNDRGRRIRLSLLQLRIFRLGLLKHGNVRVRVFPQREKILLRGACFERVALHRIGTSELEMG